MTFHRLTLSAFLLFLAAGVTAAQDASDGFVSLFNGQDLTGWHGDDRFWSVRDGAIIGQTTAENTAEHNTFLICDAGQYGDFELRFQYQVDGFNSGMQYRSHEGDDFVVSGYQADFEARWHEDGTRDKFTGMVFEENGRMFLAQRGQMTLVTPPTSADKKAGVEIIASVGDEAELGSMIRRDDWNDYTIIARGYQFTHIINGRVMAQAIDEDVDRRTDQGVFAIQLHSGPPMKIQVKNIQVRRLR